MPGALTSGGPSLKAADTRLAPRRIYACDVGSTRAGSFAWAARLPNEDSSHAVVVSTDVALLAECISRDLRAGLHVALGFEAPLAVPVPHDPKDLFSARSNERLSWSGQVGALITTQALHLAAWILRAVDRLGRGNAVVTTDHALWPPTADGPTLLLCWEAFVAGDAPAKRTDDAPHARDAATAVREFCRLESELGVGKRITADRPISLIGAAALWAGWGPPSSVLHESPLVIEVQSHGYAGALRWLDGRHENPFSMVPNGSGDGDEALAW